MERFFISIHESNILPAVYGVSGSLVLQTGYPNGKNRAMPPPISIDHNRKTGPRLVRPNYLRSEGTDVPLLAKVTLACRLW